MCFSLFVIRRNPEMEQLLKGGRFIYEAAVIHGRAGKFPIIYLTRRIR